LTTPAAPLAGDNVRLRSPGVARGAVSAEMVPAAAAGVPVQFSIRRGAFDPQYPHTYTNSNASGANRTTSKRVSRRRHRGCEFVWLQRF